jgi:hypothetical protein
VQALYSSGQFIWAQERIAAALAKAIRAIRITASFIKNNNFISYDEEETDVKQRV